MFNVIVIEVEGGCVTAVNCTSERFQVFILDRDVSDESGKPTFFSTGEADLIAYDGPMIQDIENQIRSAKG